MKLVEILQQTRQSIDACVVVGGTLLGHYKVLEESLRQGSKARFLFPDSDSPWLRPIVKAAGVTIEEYQIRILINAYRAKSLGSDVKIRWYREAATRWFVVMDNLAVASKPIDFTEQTIPIVETNSYKVQYYATIFESIWNSSSDNFFPIKESPLHLDRANPNQMGSFPVALDQSPSLVIFDRVVLRDKMTTYFSLSEIRTMCFDLQVDYESLPGEGKIDKVRELILYSERRAQLNSLIDYCRAQRNKVLW